MGRRARQHGDLVDRLAKERETERAREVQPNGLTLSAIEARPDVPVGAVLYNATPYNESWRGWRRLLEISGEWMLFSRGDALPDRASTKDVERFLLLPGEPGCPWPPPPEFCRAWQEGDRAWVRHDRQFIRWRGAWGRYRVGPSVSGEDAFFWEDGDEDDRGFCLSRPAIYIPPVVGQ